MAPLSTTPVHASVSWAAEHDAVVDPSRVATGNSLALAGGGRYRSAASQNGVQAS